VPLIIHLISIASSVAAIAHRLFSTQAV